MRHPNVLSELSSEKSVLLFPATPAVKGNDEESLRCTYYDLLFLYVGNIIMEDH